jgi:MFS family permease
MSERPESAHDAFAALRYRDFRLLIIGKLASVVGEQMLGVAIGWELWQRTGSTLALGLVGLVQVVPVFLFALPAGHIADRASRKAIVAAAQALLAAAALGIAATSYAAGPVAVFYVCLFAIGTSRAFRDPAASALIPNVVPSSVYTNAATWGSASWQFAVVLGPAAGGILIGWTGRPWIVYSLDVVAALIFLLCIMAIRTRVAPAPGPRERMSFESLVAGLTFIRRTKVLLAAITLDMFAVLLGGATALLPVFATDILHVGPVGLGWLRAAPSIGATLVALVIAHRPPFERAGRTLLWVVAGFGVATIVFGLSQSFPLSLLMLATLGGLDQVSVVIRGTLLLVKTPDELRGRVNAVHNMFVGASNELGEFESGFVAHFLGAAMTVAAGGVGTILVVLLIAAVWPEVRRLRRLQEAT